MSVKIWSEPNSQIDTLRCLRRMGAGRFSILALILGGLLACGEAVDPDALLNKGRALLQSGDLNTALIELKNAVQAAPQNPDARLALGQRPISRAVMLKRP